MTTTAIEVSRYGSPMLSAGPPEYEASRNPASEAKTAQDT